MWWCGTIHCTGWSSLVSPSACSLVYHVTHACGHRWRLVDHLLIYSMVSLRLRLVLALLVPMRLIARAERDYCWLSSARNLLPNVVVEHVIGGSNTKTSIKSDSVLIRLWCILSEDCIVMSKACRETSLSVTVDNACSRYTIHTIVCDSSTALVRKEFPIISERCIYLLKS